MFTIKCTKHVTSGQIETCEVSLVTAVAKPDKNAYQKFTGKPIYDDQALNIGTLDGTCDLWYI